MPDRLRRLDRDALYSRLDREREHRGITWHDIAVEVGMSPSTFGRLAVGSAPEADALVSLLAWLSETDIVPYIVGGSVPLTLCRDVNGERGHICELLLNHRGDHLQILGTVTAAWGRGHATSTNVRSTP